MPGLTLTSEWDGEEEASALLLRPGSTDVAVVRPSLPPVVLAADAHCLWQDTDGALVAAWDPQGLHLAVGRENGSVSVFIAPAMLLVATFQAPAPWVTALAWAPKGDTLAVAAGKTVSWWNPTKGTLQGAWTGAPSTVADLDWPPQGPLAACGYGGAWVFSQPGSAPSRKLEWKGSSLKVKWAPNLKWLTTADQDRTVHIWPWPQGGDLMMGSFDAKSLSLVWSPSGGHLATSGSAGLVLWDCRGRGPGGRKPLVGEEKGLITSIDLKDHYATVDDEGNLVVWDNQAEVLGQAQLGSPGVGVVWVTNNSLLVAQSDGVVRTYRWE